MLLQCHIDEDLSQKERAIIRLLVNHLKIEKAKNKKAHFSKEILFVECKACTYNDLVTKQEEAIHMKDL